MPIHSELIQTELTISVSLNTKEYTVVYLKDPTFDSDDFTIFDENGNTVNEASLIGLDISEHILQQYC